MSPQGFVPRTATAFGGSIRRLAEQKESHMEEGHLRPDYVPMMIAIPPKHAVSQVIG
jgi:putative transposase